MNAREQLSASELSNIKWEFNMSSLDFLPIEEKDKKFYDEVGLKYFGGIGLPHLLNNVPLSYGIRHERIYNRNIIGPSAWWLRVFSKNPSQSKESFEKALRPNMSVDKLCEEYVFGHLGAYPDVKIEADFLYRGLLQIVTPKKLNLNFPALIYKNFVVEDTFVKFMPLE